MLWQWFVCGSSAVIGWEGMDLMKPPSYGGGANTKGFVSGWQTRGRSAKQDEPGSTAAPSVRALLCKYMQHHLFCVLILMCTIKHSLLRQMTLHVSCSIAANAPQQLRSNRDRKKVRCVTPEQLSTISYDKKNTCPSFPVCNMKHMSCFPPAFIISSLPWQDIFHIAWLDNYSFITYISHAVILWLMCEGVRWESAHSRHLRFALKGHCWKIWWVTECVTDSLDVRSVTVGWISVLLCLEVCLKLRVSTSNFS